MKATEKQKKGFKKYYKENKEKINEQGREYYQKNKEKLKRYSRKYNRIYRQKHKDKERAYQKTPDRRKKQAIRDFTRELYRKEKKKKVKCLLCGNKKDLEFHHSDYDKPKKVIILCKKCHIQEHHKQTEMKEVENGTRKD